MKACNDHVFPGGLQCLSLVWGMNHLGDDSQGRLRIIWVVSLIMILLWTLAILVHVGLY